jgi:hypothetical protein
VFSCKAGMVGRLVCWNRRLHARYLALWGCEACHCLLGRLGR